MLLMLPKPWRKLHELKSDLETFETAFDRFMLQANKKIHRVVTNVQFYHECSDAAKAARDNPQTNIQLDANEVGMSYTNNQGEVAEEYSEVGTADKYITDEDMEMVLLMRTNPRECLYREAAVAMGYEIKARKMPKEGDTIQMWETQVKEVTRKQINQFGMIHISKKADKRETRSTTVGLTEGANSVMATCIQSAHQTLAGVTQNSCVERHELARLNKEQRRAHDMIEECLKERSLLSPT